MNPYGFWQFCVAGNEPSSLFAVIWMGCQITESSDWNLVNVGNADADGANVNRWNPKNRNDEIGVSLSRRAVSFRSPRNNLGAFDFCLTYPTTQHLSNLAQLIFKTDIPSLRDDFQFSCDSYKNSYRIKLCRNFFEYMEFLLDGLVLGTDDQYQHFDQEFKNLLSNRITIKF